MTINFSYSTNNNGLVAISDINDPESKILGINLTVSATPEATTEEISDAFDELVSSVTTFIGNLVDVDGTYTAFCSRLPEGATPIMQKSDMQTFANRYGVPALRAMIGV